MNERPLGPVGAAVLAVAVEHGGATPPEPPNTIARLQRAGLLENSADGDGQIKITRAGRVALARWLRDEGFTVREIAARVGLARATVHDQILGSAHRRQVIARRVPPCPRCGRPMISWKPSAPVKLCQPCRSSDADTRAREVERLWAAGATMGEIAARLGTTIGTLGSLMDRYRGQGYDLPYRHQGERIGRKFEAMAA